MADNITITEGSGTTIKTDEISGVNIQGIKVVLGANSTDDGYVATGNPMPIDTQAVDDAAAAGEIFPVGGIYQATVGTIDDGDIGRIRATARRGLVTTPDSGYTDRTITLGEIKLFKHNISFIAHQHQNKH